MNWHISLLLFYVFAVTRSLLQRRYLRKARLPSSVVSAMNLLLGIWPISIVVGLLLPHHVNWSWWVVLLLLIEGTMIGLYNKLAFRAIKRLPISHFQTINQSSTLFIILFGWVLLHETLTAVQIVGVVLILAGAVLAAFAARAKARQKAIQPRTVELVVFAAFLLSIGLIAEKAALGHMDIGAYFIFGFGMQAIVAGLIALKDTGNGLVREITHSDLRNTITFGVANALAAFMYIYTLHTANNISLVVSLNSFVLPLTALGSFFILHEREDKLKLWTAIALGVAGIIITAL